jgi:hypothetical protein
MTHDGFLGVRLDAATKMRLQAAAKEQGKSLSDLARELLWSALRDGGSACPEGFSYPKNPTVADLREQAIERLSQGYRSRSSKPWYDPQYDLNWIRAHLEETPALRGADPSSILFEIRARVGRAQAPVLRLTRDEGAREASA